MGKPFQISIRQILAAIACFSVSVWSLTALLTHAQDSNELAPFCLLALCFISMGVGIGAVTGNVVRGLWVKRIIISILVLIAGLLAMLIGMWIVFIAAWGHSSTPQLIATVIGYAIMASGAVLSLVGFVRLFRR